MFLGVPLALYISMLVARANSSVFLYFVRRRLVAQTVQRQMDQSVARESLSSSAPAAYFLIAYTFLIIIARMSERGTDPLYELLWACNTSMLLAAAVSFSRLACSVHVIETRGRREF